MSNLKNSVAAALALAAATLAPVSLAADAPVSWIVNGGWTPTTGTTSDYLKSGWTLGTGVVIQPNSSSPFALQLRSGYSDFNATSKLIQLGQSQSFRTDGGRGDVWSLTAAGKYTMPGDGPHGYGLLGHRRLSSLRRTDPDCTRHRLHLRSLVGLLLSGRSGGRCDRCEQIQHQIGLQRRRGYRISAVDHSAWFIEARYHWIDGSKATEFIPIQIGFRF